MFGNFNKPLKHMHNCGDFWEKNMNYAVFSKLKRLGVWNWIVDDSDFKLSEFGSRFGL